jgi:hypothetical protein
MSTKQTTLPGFGDATPDDVDDRSPDRAPGEDLQGYASALWKYGQLHDNPAWTDAAQYALREADE